MTSEGARHRPFSAVYLLLFDDTEILLLKRQNTGHRDGEYSLVAGHIEQGETATEAMVREAKEEIGINVVPSALQGVHVIHRNSGERVYVDLYFTADEWDGEVHNREPEKCAELAWFETTALPADTVPYVEQAITNVSNEMYSEFGW